ncbi:MAG: four helix bundle protein [Planctomycetes bacterium]|nr:four helix bundle protein [Planctomycetota bacterium]
MSDEVRNGIGKPGIVKKHTELDVYRLAFDAAMQLFELTKNFPREETYSLTDQVRRSSRSVCANLAEAWRKRRYPAAFTSKLCECEAEAAETQTWLQFAVESNYLDRDQARPLYQNYDRIMAMLVTMIQHAEDWNVK